MDHNSGGNPTEQAEDQQSTATLTDSDNNSSNNNSPTPASTQSIEKPLANDEVPVVCPNITGGVVAPAHTRAVESESELDALTDEKLRAEAGVDERPATAGGDKGSGLVPVQTDDEVEDVSKYLGPTKLILLTIGLCTALFVVS